MGGDNMMGGLNRYGLTKLANILFTQELQRQFDKEGASCIALSLHPGSVATNKFSLGTPMDIVC